MSCPVNAPQTGESYALHMWKIINAFGLALALTAPAAADDQKQAWEADHKQACEKARRALAPFLLAPKTLKVEDCYVMNHDSGQEVLLTVEAQNIYGAMIVGGFTLAFTVPDPEKLRMYGLSVQYPTTRTLLKNPAAAKDFLGQN